MPDLRLHMEDDLIQQVANGSEPAFGQLMQLYWTHLFNYMNKIVKSEVVAEELADDIFLQIWLKRHLLNDIRRFDHYLFKIARNKSIDFLRLAAKDKKLQDFIRQYATTADSDLPDQLITTAELRALLTMVLETLSPQRKLIFTLKHLEGLSNDQIASQLKLSRSTIKNTLQDSIKQLRLLLQKHGLQGIWLLAWLIDR